MDAKLEVNEGEVRMNRSEGGNLEPVSEGVSAKKQVAKTLGVLILGLGVGSAALLQLINALIKSSSDAFPSSLILWIPALLIPLIVLALVLGVRPQKQRLAALRASFPEALVLPMIQPGTLLRALRAAGYNGKRIGNYFVLVIHEGQVEIWKGSSKPKLRWAFPAADVTRVVVTTGYTTRSLPVVGLIVPDPSDGTWVLLRFSPSFEGRRLAGSLLKHDAVMVVAESIRARLELETGSSLMPVEDF